MPQPKVTGLDRGCALQAEAAWPTPCGADRKAPGGPYSVEIRSQVLALFEQGTGYRLVARRLALPVSIVQTWYLDWKIGRFAAKASRRGCNYPLQIRQKALAMLAQGLSFSSVSQQLGVKRGTVYQWARKERLARLKDTAQQAGVPLVQWSESSSAACVVRLLDDLVKTVEGFPSGQRLKIRLEIDAEE